MSENPVSDGDMEALVFRYDVLRYLATRAVYRTARRLWSARLAPLRHERIPRPVPREDGWARLEVRLSGVCGSDMSFLTARDSLYLEPEATYPFVPGHEVVGKLETDFVPGRAEDDFSDSGGFGTDAWEAQRERPSPGERVAARYVTQSGDAERLGIDDTSVAGNEEQFRAWASERGIASRKVRGYGHVFRGVFDRVIDAAGSRQSFRWALAAVRPGGRVVLLSSPASLDGVDPTPIWYREITCRGIFQYGPVPWDGRQRHPYAVLLPMLAESRVRFRDLVTHSFPLADYVRALAVGVRRHETPAIKVAFRPGGVP